jgi:hypothetical protein
VRRTIVAIRRRGVVLPDDLVDALVGAVSRDELER